MGILSKGVYKGYDIGKTIGKCVLASQNARRCSINQHFPVCQAHDADASSSFLSCFLRGSFAVVKEGIHKESGSRVAIKIVDKKDAVFDAESLELEVPCSQTLHFAHKPEFPSFDCACVVPCA
jgi:hypothetical protein